jgi:hypothetical protein
VIADVNATEKRKMTNSHDLVEVFASAVIAQNQCISEGDAKTGNRHAERYIKAARSLLAAGADSITRFAGLLQHTDPGVRVMAAAFLLKDRTAEAVAALRPLADGEGIVALGARMTLARYEEGDLEIT